MIMISFQGKVEFALLTLYIYYMLNYQFAVVVFKVHILIVTPTKVRLREKIKKMENQFYLIFI